MKNKIFLVVISLFFFVSCDLYRDLPERKVFLLTEVPDVKVDITPENYKYGQRICLSCEDSDAVIFYTKDGSVPNENNYFGADKGIVFVSDVNDFTIKAIAKKNGYSSHILELNYETDADLYLQDLGQGWILKYNDGRVLKCITVGDSPKITWNENEDLTGYSLFEDNFAVEDLKNMNKLLLVGIPDYGCKSLFCNNRKYGTVECVGNRSFSVLITNFKTNGIFGL